MSDTVCLSVRSVMTAVRLVSQWSLGDSGQWSVGRGQLTGHVEDTPWSVGRDRLTARSHGGAVCLSGWRGFVDFEGRGLSRAALQLYWNICHIMDRMSYNK